MSSNVIILIVIGVYMFALLGVSFWSTRRMKTVDSENYLMAGRNLPVILVAVLATGTVVGGASTIGTAENAVGIGLSAGWYNFISGLSGALLFALVFVKRIYRCNCDTVFEVAEKAYGRAPGLTMMVGQLLVGWGIFSVQLVAGGAILAALLPGVFTLNTGILVSAIIFGITTIVGGMWSAALSNLVNVIVIVIGLVIGLIAIISYFGGWSAIQTDLLATNPQALSLAHPGGIKQMLLWSIAMIALFAGNQAFFQFVKSAKSAKASKIGFVVSFIIVAPLGFVAAFMGLAAVAAYPEMAATPALAMPTLLGHIHPAVAGLVLSGLWAADISTAVGLAVANANVFMNGIYKPLMKKEVPEKTQVLISRISILGMLVIGYFLAINNSGIISTIVKLMTLYVPFTIALLFTLVLPKAGKKLTGHFVVIGGTIYAFIALLPFLFPTLGIPDINFWIGGQSQLGTLIVCVVLWLISILVNKSPSNYRSVFDNPEELFGA